MGTRTGTSHPKGSQAPALPVTLDLDRWLDDSAADWAIEVPAPFDVPTRAGILVGFGRRPRTFHPGQAPWLPTDFAHIAAGLESSNEADNPPFGVVREAVAFADRSGITGTWSGSEPPREVDLATFLRQAWALREALR